MADFENTFNELKSGLVSLITGTVKKRSEEALEAGKTYLESLKNDLKTWSEQVVSGELSLEDVEWLVRSKKDLGEMILLKEKGLSMVAIDNFKNELSQMLIGAVTKRLGI